MKLQTLCFSTCWRRWRAWKETNRGSRHLHSRSFGHASYFPILRLNTNTLIKCRLWKRDYCIVSANENLICAHVHGWFCHGRHWPAMNLPHNIFRLVLKLEKEEISRCSLATLSVLGEACCFINEQTPSCWVEQSEHSVCWTQLI